MIFFYVIFNKLKRWYSSQTKAVQFCIVAASLAVVVSIFTALYYKYGATIAGAFSRFLLTHNETTVHDEKAEVKGGAAEESAAQEAAVPAQPARSPLSTDYPSKLFDPEYSRRYVHGLSTARADRDAFEQAFQKAYMAPDSIRSHRWEVLRVVHRIASPGTNPTTEELDQLSFFIAYRRADRFRVIYKQKWDRNAPRG